MSVTKYDIKDLIVHMVSNTIEYVLVEWTSQYTIDIIESSCVEPWFSSTSVDLQNYCRRQDLSRLSKYYDSISPNPTSGSFSISMNGNLVNLFCSSQMIEGNRLSLWMKIPDTNRPIQFLQDAVHDMKSPLSTIIGFANLMQHDIEKSDNSSEIKDYIDHIKTSANQSVGLLNEVMELAEMESSNYQIQTVLVDMGDFVEKYLNTHRLLTLKKKIKVHYTKQSGHRVSINEMKMTRLFDNIFSNAVKFSGHNSNIHVSVHGENNEITVSVRDEGIGMPESVKRELFVKFGNAKRKGLDGEQSNGLGMSIVKQIMDLHNGEILVESEEGIGTEMILKFKKAEE